MSIYSGFATRSQQQTYDQLSYQLIQLLSARILKTYLQQPTDQHKFAKIIKQIFIKLSIMEKQKYLQPNLSSALYEIIQHYLKQEQPQRKQDQKKKHSFWVKIEDKTQQNFTLDTHKNQSRQLSTRKTSVNFNIKSKGTIINPQKTLFHSNKDRNSAFQHSIKEQKNHTNRKEQLKQEKRRIKNQSMRHFQQNRFNHNIHTGQKSNQKEKCPYCCHQNLLSKKKQTQSKPKQQRANSNSRRQIKTSRIIVPDLVKQYIEATNHTYMKNYRKRKLKFCSQYN